LDHHRCSPCSEGRCSHANQRCCCCCCCFELSIGLHAGESSADSSMCIFPMPLWTVLHRGNAWQKPDSHCSLSVLNCSAIAASHSSNHGSICFRSFRRSGADGLLLFPNPQSPKPFRRNFPVSLFCCEKYLKMVRILWKLWLSVGPRWQPQPQEILGDAL
jgi:hypothetical protein